MAPAAWAAHRINRTLKQVLSATRHLASGDINHPSHITIRQDLTNQARPFHDVMGRLAKQLGQLEADRQLLRATLSGMVEGVVALDGQQTVLFANERASELLDVEAQTVVGRKIWEVFRQRSLQALVERALAAETPCQEELVWTGNAPRVFLVHAARLTGTHARGAVLVFHDMTDLRRLEQVRRDFVANVSHELKTPLSVIRACVETLLDGALDDREHRHEFLNQISDQSERLNSLIHDLLSLNRIESGIEVFEYEAVPLARVVHACAERHRARAAAKHLVLELGERDRNGAPIHAWADEEAVEQLVDNLLDNAVKYTPNGGKVSLSWWRNGDSVGIKVSDTGIGISERDLPRVFERFYRVDKARSRALGSTGLGLAIVKHLAQAMHGSVSVTSEIGKGSEFTVTLPEAPRPTPVNSLP
jgi:two-component system phosphate regulon sensor histidine kinase PhoR